MEYWISTSVINYVAEPLNVAEYHYQHRFHIITPPFCSDKDNAYSWHDTFYPNVIQEATWNMGLLLDT